MHCFPEFFSAYLYTYLSKVENSLQLCQSVFCAFNHSPFKPDSLKSNAFSQLCRHFLNSGCIGGVRYPVSGPGWTILKLSTLSQALKKLLMDTKVLSGFVQVLFLEPLFQAFMVQSTLDLFLATAAARTAPSCLCTALWGWCPSRQAQNAAAVSPGPVWTAASQTGIFAIPFFSCFSHWQLPNVGEFGMNRARPGVSSPISLSALVFPGLVTQRAGHWAKEEEWESGSWVPISHGTAVSRARVSLSPLGSLFLPLSRKPAPLSGLGNQQEEAPGGPEDKPYTWLLERALGQGLNTWEHILASGWKVNWQSINQLCLTCPILLLLSFLFLVVNFTWKTGLSRKVQRSGSTSASVSCSIWSRAPAWAFPVQTSTEHTCLIPAWGLPLREWLLSHCELRHFICVLNN